MFKRMGLSSIGLLLFCVSFSNMTQAQTHEITFDNTDPDVGVVGDWVEYALAGAFGNNTIHTKPSGSGDAFVRYPTPSNAMMQTGKYALYSRWVANSACATNTTYRIFYDLGVYKDVFVNQQNNSSKWVLLGIFDILHPRPVIRIYDNVNGYVVADGIRYMRTGDLPEPLRKDYSSNQRKGLLDCDYGVDH